uniref:Cadherin N-terminal domain-containing protein n=1 Tax=Seriola dumerili TaxID=41447 RepID=A0A3B4U1L4_SERDU
MKRQVLLFILIVCLRLVFGQVSYSIPEEMAKGSLVGNIAQDLGLDVKRLKLGNAHVYSGDSREYIELNSERGVLLIKERIDREALCGDTTPCILTITRQPLKKMKLSSLLASLQLYGQNLI